MFLHLCILTEEIKENLIINYKILFASLFDIITKPPSLSILFFHPTLTPLLPHSPSQHSGHFIFPSHHSFHPTISHTTLFTPFSLTPLFSRHSLSLFSRHSSSHHSFHSILPHTTLLTPFSCTPLFTPFYLTPLFSSHSHASFSHFSKLTF